MTAVLLGLILSAGTASAISIETITITASVQEHLTLVFGGRTVAFASLDPSVGPVTMPAVLTFNVKSNTNWTLEVVATDDLRNTQNPQALMPAGRLLLRRVGEGAFQPVSKTVQRQVAVGGPLPPAGVDLRFDMQLFSQWEDHPGNYETTLRFILSSHP